MKVDFIIAGAAKSGSSALAEFVRKHPQVAFAPKECHFFENDDYFATEKVNYSIYHRHWSYMLLNRNKQRQSKVYGEKTPCYMYYPSSMPRIKEYNPHIKLIFILRNPVDRAYSHWNVTTEKGIESQSFFDALNQEKKRLSISNKPDAFYSYIDRGFYAQQIKHSLKFFPRQQMLFLKNDDLKNNHQEILDRVFNFIGIDTNQEIKPREVNNRQYSPMSNSDREFLTEIFAQEVSDLEKLLDWDLSDWKK